MAKKNTTEMKAGATTAMTPTITAATLVAYENDQANTSTVFKKDTVGAVIAAGGTATATYSGDYSQITVDAGAADVAITISGMSDGQEARLLVTNKASSDVTFSGATDLTPSKTVLNSESSTAYHLENIGGTVYARAQFKTNKLNYIELEIGTWDLEATSPHSFAHGLSDISKIRTIKGILIPNDDSQMRDINSFGGDITGLWAGSTNIVITSSFTGTGGIWNGTSQNRGFITIGYID